MFDALNVSRLGILILLLVALGGCDEQEIDIDELAPDASLPPARVDLPRPPPASAFVIPETNNDGSLRVEGIIEFQEKYLDETVEIRGLVAEMSEPCTARQAKERDEECLKAHFYIQDSPTSNKKLLVVGHSQEFVKRAKIKDGEQYLFKGRYRKTGNGFVASEDGLLMLEQVNDIPVDRRAARRR